MSSIITVGNDLNTPPSQTLPGASQRTSAGGYAREMEISEGMNFKAAKRKREVDVIVVDDDEPVDECVEHGHSLRQRENALARRENMAARLEARLREWDDRVGVIQQDMLSQQESLAVREEGVTLREERIGAQEEEVKKRERRTDRKEDSLRGWRDDLRDWDDRLKRRAEENERHKHKLREWETELGEWRDELQERNMSMRRLEQQVATHICVVCLDREVTNFVLQCGHRPLCRTCLITLQNEPRADAQVKCPLCRVTSKPITVYY